MSFYVTCSTLLTVTLPHIFIVLFFYFQGTSQPQMAPNVNPYGAGPVHPQYNPGYPPNYYPQPGYPPQSPPNYHPGYPPQPPPNLGPYGAAAPMQPPYNPGCPPAYSPYPTAYPAQPPPNYPGPNGLFTFFCLLLLSLFTSFVYVD